MTLILLVLIYYTPRFRHTHSAHTNIFILLYDHSSFLHSSFLLSYTTKLVDCYIRQFPSTGGLQCLFFKDYTLAEVKYLLCIPNKVRYFLGNTKNADKNDVNKQTTHKDAI